MVTDSRTRARKFARRRPSLSASVPPPVDPDEPAADYGGVTLRRSSCLLLCTLLCALLCSACGTPPTNSGSAGGADESPRDTEGQGAASAEAAPPRFFANGAERAGEGPNPIVLEWQVEMTNFRSSGDDFHVRRDRVARHVRVADRERDAFEREGTIEDTLWQDTLRGLAAQNVCALRATEPPDHEEPTGVLSLDTGALRCRVAMSEGEWLGPRARPAFDLIQALMGSLRPAVGEP